jgi:hypothetical protein
MRDSADASAPLPQFLRRCGEPGYAVSGGVVEAVAWLPYACRICMKSAAKTCEMLWTLAVPDGPIGVAVDVPSLGLVAAEAPPP